ncbi:putative ribonuclease H-like domain-containing protein [Tanacetum coccineum]
MLAIPDEHLLKFHACKDAKSSWEAIKNRFGGNKESKKMQKTILKQNYENFIASSQEGLDKTYDRFQKLISQLEIHGEVISQKDANLKLLRSVPSAWNNIALIMRNKSDLDTLSMDDLYNNLKVYESEIKGQTSSSLNSHNVAFVSPDNSNITNEIVNNAHSVSATSSKDQASTASYDDDIDADDLEEMDLKWKVAMLTMRVKRFIKKTGRKLYLNGKEGNRSRDDPRRNAPVDTSTTNALVVQDGIGGYDWSFQAEEDITNFALMAYTSQGLSSSDSEVQTCSKDCYQIGLESLEARIVVHEKNEAVYEENIAFLKYDVQVKDISIKDLKNYQISAKYKTGLGYDSQMNEIELNNIHMNESEVVHSMFNSRESDVDDNSVNDKLNTSNGFHAVPPPYIRNYMPLRPDLSFAGLDESVFQSTDTDSDNDSVLRPKSDQTKPKFTKINFVKSGENVKSVNKENTHRQVEYLRKSQSPRSNRRNWNGMMTQKLENSFEFIKKACFVCGSFNHLIKDCDFHDNKMVENPVLNNKGRVTAVATKSEQVPVNAAKQSSPRAAASISTARPVNIAAPKPKVNDALPTTYSYFQAHSPLVLLREMGKMLLSPQHAGFRDQQEMLLTIPSKTVDHTCLNDLTMLIYKADSSQHMTGNKSFLTDYQVINGRFVAFRGSPKRGKITRKGKIRTGKLDFEDVYFIKELKFNLFSVLQMCDKKNSVLFTKTECLVLSTDFKLLDESQVLLKVPRHDNMYSFDLKNVVPSGGFPLKLFENDHTCVACHKGKKHKASCKTKLVNSINQPLQMLHMHLFGPTSIRSINHKTYCLVVTDDFSRFSWVFFLATKDETSGILKTFITSIENQINHNVKIIKYDNGTEFKNNDMNQFYGMKGIKREFSVTKTPQQNRVAERKNRILIEASRTMLADLLLPATFWAEVVNTACYVQNSVLVTKPHNKTPYELLHGSGPDWLFDIDLLTSSMNYEPVTVGNQTNRNAEDPVADDVGKKITEEPANEGERNGQEKEGETLNREGDQHVQDLRAELDKFLVQQKEDYANSTNRVSTVSPSVSAAGQSFVNDLPTDPLMPDLEETTNLLNTGIFSGAYDDEDVEPKKVTQALTDPRWIEEMQDELLRFGLQKVWRLVDLPQGKHDIRTKWVHRNKKDERGIAVRNKARLVAQAYASFMGFIVYQMDVKSAFLYGTIEEDVYVCQPSSFEDPRFPDKVYKVEKALYGLHQAPKSWYETLSTYLLENRFRRGTIDKTLFIKKDKGDIMLVQVYVDDIIFGSTKKSLCVEFEQMMHKRFQMSSMRELTFFLSQDKYMADILKKFDFVIVKIASTPIETNKALLKDEEAKDVDVHFYRSMIGSLMYLIASRPDIMFAVCACVRDSSFDLEAFFNSDYAGASLDRKSTTGDGISDEIRVKTGSCKVNAGRQDLVLLGEIQSQDKGKSKIVEPESTPKNLIKAQIQREAKIAQRLFEEDQAQFEREQRIARERAAEQEAKDAALIAEFDNVQARMEADALLAARLQEEEREQFSIDEQARFLVETIAERKRFFAAQRAEQIRNKPLTKTQLRNKMITYLKNMGRYTHSQLKNKSLEEIQKLYEREQKWINDFVPMDSEEGGKKAESSKKEAASSKKRQKADPDDENVKRQKLEDAAEKKGLKAYLKIVPDEDRAVNYETLATKYPIVDWESQIIGSDLQGNGLSYWRADDNSKFYKVFSMMLEDFDRQDFVDLHRLVKERSASRALEGYDLILWGDLKTMFFWVKGYPGKVY